MFCFNGHPPLGVNATAMKPQQKMQAARYAFQSAPTLGGECYFSEEQLQRVLDFWFQWAPTLGGECYGVFQPDLQSEAVEVSMGTHPWG